MRVTLAGATGAAAATLGPVPVVADVSLRAATRWVLLIATCLAWFAYVAPASLGGRTGYIVIAGTSMEPGLHTGDVVVVRERPGTYRKGDVVAYPLPAGQVGEGQIVIHRVIAGSGWAGLVLQGDNRTTSDLWRPKDREVVWVAAFDVPKVGGLVIASLAFALVAAALAAMLVLRLAEGRDDRPKVHATTT